MQDEILGHLRIACQVGDRVIHVGIPYHLTETLQEASYHVLPMQRSRRVCVSCSWRGYCARWQSTDKLYVFENGIGAFNLPYTGAQVGSHSMRAVHPETLLRMSDLVVALTGQPFRIYNRFQWKTKAEVCEPLARDHFRRRHCYDHVLRKIPTSCPGKARMWDMYIMCTTQTGAVGGGT